MINTNVSSKVTNKTNIMKKITETEGSKEFIKAVKNGKIGEVKKFTEKYIKIINDPVFGKAAYCSLISQPKIYDYLIKKGVQDPISAAIKYGTLSGLEKVTNHKKIEITSEHMKAAASKGDVEIIKLLIENGGILPNDLLFYATENNNVEMCEFLLDKGLPLNGINEDKHKNWTAIGLAVPFGYEKLVELFISRGACIESRSPSGLTLLMNAILFKQPKIVSYLISKGADCNAKSTDELYTPLHVAAMVGDLDSTKLLINEGAEVDALDNNKATPLFYAIYKNFPSIVDYLREKNANMSNIHIWSVKGVLLIDVIKSRISSELSNSVDKKNSQRILKIFQEKACKICKNTATVKSCSGCKAVYYCNREHQIEDWKNHKKDCKK